MALTDWLPLPLYTPPFKHFSSCFLFVFCVFVFLCLFVWIIIHMHSINSAQIVHKFSELQIGPWIFKESLLI